MDPRHDVGGFDSGVDALDRYLRTQASQDQRRRVSTCFVLTEDRVGLPLGYYTLAATGLSLTALPAQLTKRLPRYPMIPACLMGRLAVDRRYQGKRLGEFLLMDALHRTLRSEVACFAFVVDAKDERAAAFYRHYEFLPLTADGRRLFLPMNQVIQLFA